MFIVGWGTQATSSYGMRLSSSVPDSRAQAQCVVAHGPAALSDGSLPEPRIKTVSSALIGRFLTTKATRGSPELLNNWKKEDNTSAKDY